jgi:Ca-activated chloride channel family protein
MLFSLQIGGVRFSAPVALFGLIVVPLLALAYVALQRKRSAAAIKFTNLDLLADITEGQVSAKRHVPAVLFLLALVVLLIGIGQPQAKRLVQREEATVMLIIDVSGSMSADDVRPTRMEAAKVSANTFLDQVPDRFRVGLIAFSTNADIVSQPTTDRDLLRQAIDGLKPEGGTALSTALDRAIQLKRDLERPTTRVPQVGSGTTSTTTTTTTTTKPKDTTEASSSEVPFVILILTDGAQTVGERTPQQSANDARKENIPIFSISLGTRDGTIRNPDSATAGVQPFIEVPPDPATLREISAITGGKSFTAESAGELQSVYQALGSKVGEVRQETDITYFFAIGAVFLLLISAGLSLLWQERLP